MWSREGLKSANSTTIYRSTPHLFVYQPTLDDDEVDMRRNEEEEEDDEPSDSGYADSTRSAGAGSAGSETTPEAIYYTTSTDVSHEAKEQDAIRRLSQIDCTEQAYNRPATNTTVPAAAPLTELEILRAETFFRGHQTQLFVGRSLANLYIRQTNSLVGLNRCSSTPDVCVRTMQRQSDRVTDWELKFTGIPVVLLDMGATKSRRQRRIQLILAERDTGFTLWKDTIDNLSNYEAAGPTFHTMRTSVDHRQIAGLSFDSAEAAKELFEQLEKWTSDPANIRLSAPKGGAKSLFRFFKSSKDTEPAKKKTLKSNIKKCEISQPCFFQHVTSVDLTDRRKTYTLQSLVPPQ